jgi:aryl-alcohol dehydrogenase-like predicted oxidoreductase
MGRPEGELWAHFTEGLSRPSVPFEETMGALVQAVPQGKALYVGISLYGPEQSTDAGRESAELKAPQLVSRFHPRIRAAETLQLRSGPLDVSVPH